MSRIAIVGSCITRDLWPVRGEGAEGLLYLSRTSLPSLFSRAPDGFEAQPEPPGGLTRSQHKAVVQDVAKQGLAALLAFRPTHLIVDLIDERFDLLSVGGAVITHSWELEEAGYRSQPALQGAYTIPRLSPACDDLWIQGALDFAALIQATPLRDAVVILHEAQWAERYLDAQGKEQSFGAIEIFDGHAADLSRHNALLRTYQRELAALLPDLQRVAAPEGRIADENHRWGLSPFHYAAAYYDAIRDQLTGLGV